MTEFEKPAEFLKALGHPVRLKMVCYLQTEEQGCNVNKMVEELKISQSSVSQHLNILKNNGIVTVRNEGVRRCYRIIDPDVIKIVQLLKPKK